MQISTTTGSTQVQVLPPGTNVLTLLSQPDIANMIVTIFSAAAVATAVTLAVSSGQNMWQTYSMLHMVGESDTVQGPASCWDTNVLSSADSLVGHLRHCQRKDFLHLFLYGSTLPTLLQLQDGQWNATLLDNNGMIMVRTQTRLLPCKHGCLHGPAFYWFVCKVPVH